MSKKDPAEISANSIPQGPGEKLKRVREQHKLTVEEIAAQLRLSSHRLADIEIDDYRQLRSPAFARGYLRNYARLLNVSEEEIIKEFDKRNLSETIATNKPNLIVRRRSSAMVEKISRWILLGLISVSVVGATIWWFATQKDNQTSLLGLEKIKQVIHPHTEMTAASASESTAIIQPLPIQSVISQDELKQNKTTSTDSANSSTTDPTLTINPSEKNGVIDKKG